MKKFLLLTSILAISISLLSQSHNELLKDQAYKKNSFYIEAGGNALFYSVNYDRILFKKGINRIAARIGFMAFPERYNMIYGVPVELSLLIGKNKHFFETGLGYTYYYDNNYNYFIVPRLGYRLQKPEGGFFFKCGYTPIYPFLNLPYYYNAYNTNYQYNNKFNHWIGISFGYTLKK